MSNKITFDELRGLALTIAPELQAAPLYILLPPVPIEGHFIGYAIQAGIDHITRDVLVESGEWQGPGTTIVLADAADKQTFLHELAHVLPPSTNLGKGDLEPTPALRARQRERFDKWMAEPVAYDKPPWRPDHGRRFVRMAIHVWYRAIVRGNVLIPLNGLCAGADYEMSNPHLYFASLGDEPARMLDATFKEIQAEPAPEQFEAVWQSDVDFWKRTAGVTNPCLL